MYEIMLQLLGLKEQNDASFEINPIYVTIQDVSIINVSHLSNVPSEGGLLPT